MNYYNSVEMFSVVVSLIVFLYIFDVLLNHTLVQLLFAAGWKQISSVQMKTYIYINIVV